MHKVKTSTKCHAAPLALLTLMLCFTSCATQRQHTYVERTATTLSLDGVKIQTRAIVADLSISDSKASANERWTWGHKSEADIEQRKQALMNEMLERSGADVLVGAKVTIKKRWIGTSKLTLTGYPAKYSNIRTANEQDLANLEKDEKVEKKHIIAVKGETNPSVDVTGLRHPLATNTWRILAGGSLLFHNGADISHTPTFSGQVGADYRRRIGNGRWYLGAMAAFESGCMRGSDDRSLTFCNLSLVPLRIGRSCYVNDNNSLHFSVGPVVDWMLMAKPQGRSARYGGSCLPKSGGMGVGMETNIGWQWKRWSLELAPRLLFYSPLYDSASLTTHFTLRAGYTF